MLQRARTNEQFLLAPLHNRETGTTRVQTLSCSLPPPLPLFLSGAIKYPTRANARLIHKASSARGSVMVVDVFRNEKDRDRHPVYSRRGFLFRAPLNFPARSNRSSEPFIKYATATAPGGPIYSSAATDVPRDSLFRILIRTPRSFQEDREIAGSCRTDTSCRGSFGDPKTSLVREVAGDIRAEDKEGTRRSVDKNGFLTGKRDGGGRRKDREGLASSASTRQEDGKDSTGRRAQLQPSGIRSAPKARQRRRFGTCVRARECRSYVAVNLRHTRSTWNAIQSLAARTLPPITPIVHIPASDSGAAGQPPSTSPPVYACRVLGSPASNAHTWHGPPHS